MISKPVAAAIRSGDVTQAFRRWDTARVTVGGTQLTSAGIVRFESVEQVDPADLTETDAVAARMADLPALQRLLAPRSTAPSARGGRGGAQIYRVTLRWIGEDPRIALRDHVPRGLTISHDVGYEVSPRGAAYLRHLKRQESRPTN